MVEKLAEVLTAMRLELLVELLLALATFTILAVEAVMEPEGVVAFLVT